MRGREHTHCFVTSSICAPDWKKKLFFFLIIEEILSWRHGVVSAHVWVMQCVQSEICLALHGLQDCFLTVLQMMYQCWRPHGHKAP